MMLNRRGFLAGSAACTLGFVSCAKIYSNPIKRLSITMDDFDLKFDQRLMPLARNQAILDAFSAHNHKAAGFVTGRFVDNDLGHVVLQSWQDAGHMLCNHTYAHMNSSREDSARIKEDILKNEQFLSNYDAYAPYFRFPFLAEGGDMPKIIEYRSFLKAHGLSNAPVTIDSIDWYVSGRMEKRLRAAPQVDTAAYRDYYVKSVMDIANYQHQLAQALGYPEMPHTLLMHHNILNGLYLRDLMDALSADGWQFVDAHDAFDHPIYKLHPTVPTRGRSFLSALAEQNGVEDTGFPKPYYGYGKKTMDRLGL